MQVSHCVSSCVFSCHCVACRGRPDEFSLSSGRHLNILRSYYMNSREYWLTVRITCGNRKNIGISIRKIVYDNRYYEKAFRGYSWDKDSNIWQKSIIITKKQCMAGYIDRGFGLYEVLHELLLIISAMLVHSTLIEKSER